MAASTLAIGSSSYELLELLGDSPDPPKAAAVSQSGNRVTLQGPGGTISETGIINTGTNLAGATGALGSDQGLNLNVFSNLQDVSIRSQEGDDNLRLYGNLDSSNSLSREDVGSPNNGVFTGNGNDNVTIRGSVDSQVIAGGTGSDTIRISGSVEDSYIFGGGGSDIIGDGSDNISVRGNISNSYVNTGAGNDYAEFQSTATNLIFQGDSGNDTVIFRQSVASNFVSGDGTSSIFTGSGNDVLTFENGARGTSINTGTGNDTLLMSGEFYNDTINLSVAADSETPAGSDYLYASSNSIFDSSSIFSNNTAGDTLVFGASNSFINTDFLLGSGNDLINFGANAAMLGASGLGVDLGAGNDTIVFGAGGNFTGLEVSLGGGADVIRFVGATSSDLGTLSGYISDASSEDTLYIGSVAYSYDGSSWGIAIG